MKSSRFPRSCALALALLTFTAAAASADVKNREKGQVKFEGMLGTMTRMFGGKAASEGIISTNAVKGSRKATLNDTTGRIVDLQEEKVYDLDMKKKEYTVTTFAELRKKLQEAQERAAKEAREAKDAPKETADQKPANQKEVEFDFDVKETGQKKSIAGYDAREVVMTLTVREKGKTLDESGGIVVTMDSWLGPEIPALKELAEFEMKYWKAIAPETATISAEQMATVMAMYPLMKPAMDRLNQEKVNLKGTSLATTTTFEAVKSKAQIEEQNKNSGGGGLSGMLARKMMKKNDNPRATIFTANTETLEIATAVAAEDVAVPAGFKQKG
ncbi:MAG TPA: hypothetical protein VFJ02_15295 [Vicinamibacterales bacterium]|nr:hypothetical protein [Vicinamibacterales bacterium]